MKKFLSGILFLLISVFIFADSSASIEGVIEVAGKDELPAGYFGKATGYFPGDSVSITNPNTGITLQILNLGTLDASSGIAILISEESAKSLGIERNSGVKVKLAPRSGYFDETVSGNAVLDEKTLPAEKEETAETSSEPAVQAEPESSQPVENAAVAAELAPVAVAGVPLIADTEDNGDEENAEVAAVEDEASENEADFSDEEIAADEEPSVESVEKETEPVIVEAPAQTEECEVPEESPADEVPEEPYEDYESVEYGFLESKEAVEQPSPAEESEAEAVTIEEPAPIEEKTDNSPEEENAELVVVEEPPVEEEPESQTEPEVSAEDEIEEEAVTVEEPSPIEEDSAEEVSEPEEVVAEPTVEPETQSSEESENSDYAPIILVPSEPESPEPSAPASSEDEPIEIVPVESVPEEKTAEPEPLQAEYPVNIQNHVVSSESALASNCYYIQIATMGNIKNIENLLVKYSKYPVSLIPAGKNYRVLVGPLSVDEYGAVLAKFKDAGFKDAFVRKR